MIILYLCKNKKKLSFLREKTKVFLKLCLTIYFRVKIRVAFQMGLKVNGYRLKGLSPN